MAKRGRKKNPVNLKLLVVSIGAVAAAGVAAYGVSRAIKARRQDPRSLGEGAPAYEYRIIRTETPGGRPVWKAEIRKQGKTRWPWWKARFTKAQVKMAAEEFIYSRGGTPVDVTDPR